MEAQERCCSATMIAINGNGYWLHRQNQQQQQGEFHCRMQFERHRQLNSVCMCILRNKCACRRHCRILHASKRIYVCSCAQLFLEKQLK